MSNKLFLPKTGLLIPSMKKLREIYLAILRKEASRLDARVVLEGALLSGKYIVEVFNNREEMKLISTSEGHNIVTDEGLNRLLDVMLHGTTQIGTWYCSIFESNSTPAANWTYDLYADSQCTEWQSYDEAARVTYNEAASSGKSVTNSANKAQFTANATKTLYGAALVSVSTKGNHAAGADNVIYSAGTFAASQPVIAANVVQLTYTCTSADDGV